jgi:NDP-sugar pyrophosphorylase family protein
MIDLSGWPALVLTAGLATRLRPLSEVRAKAAMPVAGRALITRILEWLGASGIRRAVLNLHQRPETITRIVGDGAHLGLEVRYSWEARVLGSAGGPRRALPLLDADRFFVINGDTLTDCDLQSVAKEHLDSHARVTMAVVEGDVARYGGVLIDPLGAVCGFGRPTEGLRALHFIGVQATDAATFKALSPDEPHETVRKLYPEMIAAQPGAVRAAHTHAEFLDVGTASDYLKTVSLVAAREGRSLDVGVGGRIAADARLERTIVWDRVTIGPGTALTNCVVADDVVVPAGARIENSVLVQRGSTLLVTPFRSE